ncbi:hypothetical protein BB559_003450 [Furculomyces boomerangus]|uniref:Uncharacterized protein n=1 Tax=Furculomyces boomerangus TaxID=61424 RepID=A0A2T9YL71_9FUNG|nr:hypothetical protein BB559_003450 [Furculomyces boomerangus]
MTKDAYESAGLLGKQSPFPTSIEKRYLVEIDLKKKSMRPGEKQYERIKWSFSNVLTERYEFLLGYFDAVTGESREFSINESVDGDAKKAFSKVKPSWECSTRYLDVPESIFSTVDFCTQMRESWFQSDVKDLFEWIGMVSIESEFVYPGASADPFISVYSVPSPNKSCSVSLYSIRGLIHPNFIFDVVNHLTEELDDFVVFVSGFEDSPVSWNKRNHGYLYNGENLYCQIRNPKSNHCLTLRHCGAYDETC